MVIYQANVVLSMDTICDHLFELICFKKKDEHRNVYLRKKIGIIDIVEKDIFTNIITAQCRDMSS
jgi:hypothetical protein